MDLTFQVPMQYCSSQHWTLLSPPDTSTTGRRFHFGPALFLELFLHASPVSILDAHWSGGLIFQRHIFLPFHTVHGILETRILEWFAIPFSSGPRFVRTFHHDMSVLGGPAWLIASLSYTKLWSIWSFWLAFCDCGFHSGGCGAVGLASSIWPLKGARRGWNK